MQFLNPAKILSYDKKEFERRKDEPITAIRCEIETNNGPFTAYLVRHEIEYRLAYWEVMDSANEETKTAIHKMLEAAQKASEDDRAYDEITDESY